MLSKIFTTKSILSLLLFWITIVVFQKWSDVLLSDFSFTKAILVFGVLLTIIILASFAVVGEIDAIAHKIGEPYGTLVLTLTIVAIEVILIVSMLFGPTENPTIAKDSVFSIMMIIINLVMGICLLIGGLKFGEQNYNNKGSMIYMLLIVFFGGIGLVLPSFMEGKGGGEMSTPQALLIAIVTILIYAGFIYFQVKSNSHYFQQPSKGKMRITQEELIERNRLNTKEKVDMKEIAVRVILLIFFILPIVLLSHDLGLVVDYGIEEMNLPTSLSGILIAIIVFTPESISAINAASRDDFQSAINLCHGAFVSTVGLTIPAVLIIGLMTQKQIILGLSAVEIVLFVMTFLLTMMVFNGKKTNPLTGFIHIALFVVYIMLVFNG